MSRNPQTTQDKSKPRAARKAGDLSRDRRGRVMATPPILNYGFRPFFFLAAVYAGLAVPLWLLLFSGVVRLPGTFAGVQWHAHEMLFGYLAAVIAGFVLTAVPNWTGRLPLSGGPLAMLAGLWLAGRLACLVVSNAWLAMAVDLAFPVFLVFAIWREVLAGKNWKNAPVAAIIAVFGVANALDHLGNDGLVSFDLGQRLALAAAAMLIALIGGRIVPSFTRNWLVKQGRSGLPASFGYVDKITLAVTAAGLAAWLLIPGTAVCGTMLCAAGALLALRLARWRGLATVREPILIILHIGYGWLALAMLLLGVSTFGSLPTGAAVHALTAGAIGTMTLAVMTRATLGHTGRAIAADSWVVAMYALVFIGAVLRVAAPLSGQSYLEVIIAGGATWSAAFLLFAIRFAPALWGARVASR